MTVPKKRSATGSCSTEAQNKSKEKNQMKNKTKPKKKRLVCLLPVTTKEKSVRKLREL